METNPWNYMTADEEKESIRLIEEAAALATRRGRIQDGAVRRVMDERIESRARAIAAWVTHARSGGKKTHCQALREALEERVAVWDGATTVTTGHRFRHKDDAFGHFQNLRWVLAVTKSKAIRRYLRTPCTRQLPAFPAYAILSSSVSQNEAGLTALVMLATQVLGFLPRGYEDLIEMAIAPRVAAMAMELCSPEKADAGN